VTTHRDTGYGVRAGESPIRLLDAPGVGSFTERVLTARYTNWGLDPTLARRILDTVRRHADSPEDAIRHVHAGVMDFQHCTAWRDAYARYERQVKYSVTFAQVRSLLAGARPERVVDVGAGSLRLGHELAYGYPGARVVGTDVLDHDPPAGPPNLEFRRQREPTRIPVGDASADVVVLNAVLHHVQPHDVPALLADVRRILAPRGQVVLVEDTYSLHAPVTGRHADRRLTEDFLAETARHGPQFAHDLFSYFDWHGNILVGGATDMPMAYNFQPLEGWLETLDSAGLPGRQARYFGFLALGFHKTSVGAVIAHG